METTQNLKKAFSILSYIPKDDPGLASQIFSSVVANDPDNTEFLLNLGYLPSGTDDATAILITSYFESDGQDRTLEKILAKGVDINIEVEVYEEYMNEYGDIFEKYGYSVRKIQDKQRARKTEIDEDFGSLPVFLIRKRVGPSTGRQMARGKRRETVDEMEQ